MLPYVLHETDLFRPHEDPDDHYDLACQFALAKMGRIRLAGVLIDWPPSPGYGDPDVLAAAQMNQLTGQCAPVGVGCPPGESGGTGEALLRRTLEDAPDPVTLHIVGSSRDVARFGRENPELFRKKVRAIYLNAGSGTDSGRLEYNVALDPKAYAEIFRLPCAIYWMPCFHSVFAPGGEMEVGEVWNLLSLPAGGRIRPDLAAPAELFSERAGPAGEQPVAFLPGRAGGSAAARAFRRDGAEHVVHGRISARGGAHGASGRKSRAAGRSASARGLRVCAGGGSVRRRRPLPLGAEGGFGSIHLPRARRARLSGGDDRGAGRACSASFEGKSLSGKRAARRDGQIHSRTAQGQRFRPIRPRRGASGSGRLSRFPRKLFTSGKGVRTP